MAKEAPSDASEALARYKAAQQEVWSGFAPIAAGTTPAAARLVSHAGVRAGQRVLDVACGTGVVAVTAARRGAHTTGLDLTPTLLEHARQNASTAGVEIDFHEGDVEALPFEDGRFDVVLSQFGHIFAPRPGVAVGELLRVLRPGGTLAFSTWPPHLFVGRFFAVVARAMPSPPPGFSPPELWGEPRFVREQLGNAVTDVRFDMGRILSPALSPQHNRVFSERTIGPLTRAVDALAAANPAALAALRAELDALAAEFFEDNTIRQDYLMTRATRR